VAGRASGAKMGGDGGGLLISPEGVAPSRMVCLCYLPMHHKVQKKISSGTGCDAGSPGKKVVKQLCVCVCVGSVHQRAVINCPNFCYCTSTCLAVML